MKSGEHIPECDVCTHHEKEGIKSLREFTNEKHPYENVVRLRGLEWSWDNKCNYACVTCKPESSTVWEERLGKVDKTTPSYAGINWSDLKHLAFTGGEPTIQKEFSPEFFTMLGKELDSDCSFSMNTNCSKFVHREWVDFVASRDSTIMLSLDGVGKTGEWIRHGLRMDVWKRNALRWKGIAKVECNFVLTNYSLWQVSEVEDYLNELDIPIRWTNCFEPPELSPSYLPDYIKLQVPPHPFVDSILDKHYFNPEHCARFLWYTEYLNHWVPIPDEAKKSYDLLKKMSFFS